MIFTSDNWAGAHPNIARALSDQATGFASAYGTSELDRKVEATFNRIFEREVAVFFVATGTAANSIALASVAKPGGVAFCHHQAHVIEDECGAPDFFSGNRLQAVDGANGKIDPNALDSAIERLKAGGVHGGQPSAITITQATESGTVYVQEEIAAISSIARKHGLPLHMDGARFANALDATGLSPAEMTHHAGVDILSFGGTKNGCWCAEAVVFLDPEMAAHVPFIRKRGAQLFSKSRFISAQFDAYLNDGLWLELARHANAMAASLSSAIEQSSTCRLAWSSQANEVFAILPRNTANHLRSKGAAFHDWPVPHDCPQKPSTDETLVRLVTSFATTEGDIAQFAETLS